MSPLLYFFVPLLIIYSFKFLTTGAVTVESITVLLVLIVILGILRYPETRKKIEDRGEKYEELRKEDLRSNETSAERRVKEVESK